MINISAPVDGVEIPEATAKDLLYEVASSSFIPGLDELLGGASTGDIRQGPGTLPPDSVRTNPVRQNSRSSSRGCVPRSCPR